MTLYYLDASAWVKRYQQEQGTEWVEQLLRSNAYIACSVLGVVEVSAVLGRRVRGGGLMEQSTLQSLVTIVQIDWQRFLQIDIHSPVIDQSFAIIENYYLRGADAVHLASALSLVHYCLLSDTVIVAASDEELLGAASEAGLNVINPALLSIP
jgi:predicted nucleic acid-binding protein